MRALVTRWLAFALLTCAAFAWSLPWLDRPGTAALGLAFAALALSPGVARAYRPAGFNLPRRSATPADAEPGELDDLLSRIGQYTDR